MRALACLMVVALLACGSSRIISIENPDDGDAGSTIPQPDGGNPLSFTVVEFSPPVADGHTYCDVIPSGINSHGDVVGYWADTDYRCAYTRPHFSFLYEAATGTVRRIAGD